MESESIQKGVREKRLESWYEFIDLVRNECDQQQTFIFRGEGNADWSLRSSLDRLEARFPETVNELGNPSTFRKPPVRRDIHLEAFKECVRGKRGDNPRDLVDEEEWWALAQHHGAATPLLDWAYSPFVALFFAFEHEGHVDWTAKTLQVPTDRAIYIALSHRITEVGPAGAPDPPMVFSPRREITGRLSSQTGVLMKMPKGAELIQNVRDRFSQDSTDSNSHANPILTKVIIPNIERDVCLRFLDRMNINRMTLFADLDGAAAYINRQWELGWQTNLGFLPDKVAPSKAKPTFSS